MSAIEKLEQRLTALEAEVAMLKNANGAKPVDDRPWFEMIYGTFANDPHYEEAMRLGRKYRKSTKPKSKKKKAKTAR